MIDYIITKLEKIPAPLRDPTMMLEEIIGTQGVTDIINEQVITFHAAGDTGHEMG